MVGEGPSQCLCIDKTKRGLECDRERTRLSDLHSTTALFMPDNPTTQAKTLFLD